MAHGVGRRLDRRSMRQPIPTGRACQRLRTYLLSSVTVASATKQDHPPQHNQTQSGRSCSLRARQQEPSEAERR